MDRLLPDGTVPKYGANQTRSMFTPLEDKKLMKLVSESGKNPNWRAISIVMKTRTPRQCRERYQNYLNPSLEHVSWTKEEDNTILEKYEEVGPKWNQIAKILHGRTGNSIRNRFQSLQRRLKKDENNKICAENIQQKALNETVYVQNPYLFIPNLLGPVQLPTQTSVVSPINDSLKDDIFNIPEKEERKSHFKLPSIDEILNLKRNTKIIV